jgi:Phage Mu protein F like protein
MTPAIVVEPIAPSIKGRRQAAEALIFIERMVARWAVPMERLLLAEGRRAADAYERTASEGAALHAVDDEQYTAYLNRLWLSTVPLAGNLVADQLSPGKAAPALPPLRRPRAPEAIPDPFVDAAARWLRVNGGERVQSMTQTSRDEIGNQIRIGVTKGESRQEIAERITKHRRSVTPGRAATIARTEVHAATNYASLEAAKESPAPLLKIWVARAGARPAHASAMGQRQLMDDAFVVGGYRMNYPGDPWGGAPASLLVNCRCVMVYEVTRDEPAPRRRPRAA